MVYGFTIFTPSSVAISDSFSKFFLDFFGSRPTALSNFSNSSWLEKPRPNFGPCGPEGSITTNLTGLASGCISGSGNILDHRPRNLRV